MATRALGHSQAGETTPVETGGADALLEGGVPHSAVGASEGNLAEASIPFVAGLAGAGPVDTVPLLAIDAFQTGGAIEVQACRADTLASSPHLPTHTWREYTGILAPDKPIGTSTFVISIDNLPTPALRQNPALDPIPESKIGALAAVSVDIPDPASSAGIDLRTGVPVPDEWALALATPGAGVPGPAVEAGDAALAIPVEGGWALAQVGDRVQELAGGAAGHAGCAIPLPAGTAGDAGVVGGAGCAYRAEVDACAVVVDLVTGAVLALGPSEEYEAEGKVFEELSS